MATKIEKTEQLLCDLCGRQMNPDESVTLYRTDNRVSAVKVAASALLRPQEGGQSNVDICPACHQRPVQDVIGLMYPRQA
jgi:hypothetical protein